MTIDHQSSSLLPCLIIIIMIKTNESGDSVRLIMLIIIRQLEKVIEMKQREKQSKEKAHESACLLL